MAERRCSVCARCESEAKGQPKVEGKRRKKSSAIDFDGPQYLKFADCFSDLGQLKILAMAETLGVQDVSLFSSFMRYLLGVAELRSGLPEERLPRSTEGWGLRPLPEFCRKAVASSDVLHAPARARAQKMVQLYDHVKTICNAAEPTPKLISAWLFLVMISVYVGDVAFVYDFIADDKFFHDTLQGTLCEALQGDFAVLATLVRERLLFWALCRQELNCFFNCQDGRRTVPNNSLPETDDEADQEAPEDDQGDPSKAGGDLPQHRQAGIPRVAFRSRWVDTLVALVPLWARAAETSGQQIFSLLEVVVTGHGNVDQSVEALRRHFGGISGLGCPSSVSQDSARGYRVKFLLSYTFCFLRRGRWFLLELMLHSSLQTHTHTFSSHRNFQFSEANRTYHSWLVYRGQASVLVSCISEES